MAAKKADTTTPTPTSSGKEPTHCVGKIPVDLHDWLMEQGWTVEDAVRGFHNIFNTFESKGEGNGRLKTLPYVETKG